MIVLQYTYYKILKTMKLLIVTVVEYYRDDVLKLFKEAKIENFSGSDIDGYKNPEEVMVTKSWFPSQTGGMSSAMFFSFTEDAKINRAFELMKEFNRNIETKNPIRAIVLPIEKSL